MSEQWNGLHYHDRHVTAPIVTIGAIKIALDGGDA